MKLNLWQWLGLIILVGYLAYVIFGGKNKPAATQPATTMNQLTLEPPIGA